MNQQEFACGLNNMNFELQMLAIVDTILDMLEKDPELAEPVINISSIQQKCVRQGISLEKFSMGLCDYLHTD